MISRTFNGRNKIFTTMKTKIITFIFTFAVTSLAISQNNCNPPTDLSSEVSVFDVLLSWSEPMPPTKVVDSYPSIPTNKYSEYSPVHNIVTSNTTLRDYLDLQFYWYTYHNDGEAGIACDGQYYYTTAWNDIYIFKYDIDGNFLDTIIFDGVSNLRNLVYCETDGYFYGSSVQGAQGIYILDFDNDTVVDHISITTNMGCRALGYNQDLDVFYTNNWSTDILVVDRVSRSVIDTVPLTGAYSSYYGFAYDYVSDGGPFVWGFSQDNNGAELVQMTLPGFIETGFTIDVNSLTSDSSDMSIAGGLFIQEGLVDSTVTLGGNLQNSLVFGLELGVSTPSVPILDGYNVYRDDILINSALVQDTFYYDYGLETGT